MELKIAFLAIHLHRIQKIEVQSRGNSEFEIHPR